MVEEKELRVEGDNLTRVSFFCDCGAEIMFDLSENKQRDIPWNEKRLQCSVCYR